MSRKTYLEKMTLEGESFQSIEGEQFVNARASLPTQKCAFLPVMHCSRQLHTHQFQINVERKATPK